MELSEIRQYMSLALAEAGKCQTDVPVGAIIIKDGAVIGCGHNQREELQDPLAHAEMLAIRQAAAALKSWRLSGCILVSTLEPCPMCAEASIQSRMQTVIFGAYDVISGAAGSRFNLYSKRQSLPTPELITGILEEDCAAILKQFFARRRQKQD